MILPCFFFSKAALGSENCQHRKPLDLLHFQYSMEDAKTRMEAEKENAKATKAQIDELISWAECFEAADIGTNHLIVARLIDRILLPYLLWKSALQKGRCRAWIGTSLDTAQLSPKLAGC